MISANDRRRILAKLIHARHDLEDALAQHPVHVGKQIKCSRCGSLLPIFEGVTTVVQCPAYVARPAVSAKPKLHASPRRTRCRRSFSTIFCTALRFPQADFWSAEGFTLGEDAFPKLTRHWPEGLRVAMSDTCSRSG